MSRFGVRPEKERSLLDKMAKLRIRESDLKEKFIRSGGKGGQNVNKTATCVYLKHLPTGIEVKVQKERSQGINRFLALRLLLEKYENLILKKQTDRDDKVSKIRKQKKRRGRRSRSKGANGLLVNRDIQI